MSKFISWYWDGILGKFLGLIQQWFFKGQPLDPPWPLVLKILLSIVILFVIYELYLYFLRIVRKRKLRDAVVLDGTTASPLGPQDSRFVQSIEATKDLEGTIEPLKRAKRYDRLGEIYASLNRPREAARWFRKAGDKRRAAMEWAKAGKTLKAARMLLRAGDYATAARFFAEKGKDMAAAKAYARLGDLPGAASAYAKAGRYPQAAAMFKNYFAQTRDGGDLQIKAADQCYTLLSETAGKDKLPEADRRALAEAVAARFEAAQRFDLAARLFMAAGDFNRAGDVFLHMGRLEDAARCKKQAGKEREAVLIGARYYESKQLWKEAGMAYRGGQEWRKAGDCFSKALDPVSAAECYERAGEFFGAGFALVHADKWDSAIAMFQNVKEDHQHFNESRALLGRCFYELHDYAHCTATLENHLMGERVRTGNIEYFWMLALAYEQLGELEKSKQVLLKIQSVNVGYRDVKTRLSSIESRISMGHGLGRTAFPAGSAMGTEHASGPDDATQIMTMVANAIGARYRIEKELGRGGMGVVYLARDTQLDRPVALKFLGTLLDGSDEYRMRFLREARTAAKVSHPNIVSIYDICDSAGRAYIAMEYIEGMDLHRYSRQKQHIPPREAINIIGQVCSALQAVHDAGIVHRDIKPDNIVIARGGLVKLMDFGLAKGTGMRLTSPNMVMGTPCYMSPEQCRGEEVDARTDLYALGLVLHEILTGQTYFLDGDVLSRQQTENPPRPGELVEGIPELLDQVVLKCVAKAPAERFQTARELAANLRQVKFA